MWNMHAEPRCGKSIITAREIITKNYLNVANILVFSYLSGLLQNKLKIFGLWNQKLLLIYLDFQAFLQNGFCLMNQTCPIS